jgi:hypothetical protein
MTQLLHKTVFGIQIIAKLVAYIDAQGKLQLKNWDPPEEVRHKTKKALFTVLDTILHTEALVPNEIRHFLAIIKNVVTVAFNSRGDAFAAIAGCFLVRFVCAAIADPEKNGWAVENPEDDVVRPFARLLQMPFSGSVFGGKYAPCMRYNRHLLKVFPQLLNFTFAIAKVQGGDEEVVPDYPAPSDQRLTEALETVLKIVYDPLPGKRSSNYENFVQRFNAISDSKGTTGGWALASYFTSFFKDVPLQ